MNGLIYATRTLGFVNAPALMQRIVAELTDSSVDVSIYSHRRDAFTAVLDEVHIEYAVPDGAFYLFCKVPEKRQQENTDAGVSPDMAFINHLKKYLILGVPGSGFGKPGWLRFAYCIDENIIRASALAFKQALDDW